MMATNPVSGQAFSAGRNTMRASATRKIPSTARAMTRDPAASGGGVGPGNYD